MLVSRTMVSQITEALHELSQPLTVLLCSLDHGLSLDSPEEMKQAMRSALDASDRMRDTVRTMQCLLQPGHQQDAPTGSGASIHAAPLIKHESTRGQQ